jgi:TRAP-type transport system periplasmic protein
MRRRLLLAAPALIGLARPALAAPISVRVSTAAPPSDFLAKALTSFKDTLAQSAPGEFTINTYPGSTLFRQGTEMPAIQRGNLEMSTGTTFEVAEQMPEYGFFNRGYLLRDYDHLRRVFDGPIGEDYRTAVAQKMGITILAVGYLGTRQVNLRTKRDVHAPADLAGVKMRMPGDPEWLLLGRAIGVSPVPMGMAEVYLALKTGTIDGQENPLSILNAAKFYEVTQQVVLTSHLVQPVFLDIGAKAWAKLTDDQQQKVRTAAVTAMKQNDEGRLADEKRITEDLRTRGLTVSEIDLTPFRKNADAVYADAPNAQKWDKALMQKALAA